jgi:hypothetical protein
MFDGGEFLKKLRGTEFVVLVPDAEPKLRLTDAGKKFAQWLEKSGYKADFFESEFGGWGTPFDMSENRPTPRSRPPE